MNKPARLVFVENDQKLIEAINSHHIPAVGSWIENNKGRFIVNRLWYNYLPKDTTNEGNPVVTVFCDKLV